MEGNSRGKIEDFLLVIEMDEKVLGYTSYESSSMGSSLMRTALATTCGSGERRSVDDELLEALVIFFCFKTSRK